MLHALPLGTDLTYLDQVYARFLADRQSLDPSWHELIAALPPPIEIVLAARFGQVYALVNAYRARGHLRAHLDPLAAPRPGPSADLELDPRSYGFSDGDQTAVVPSGGFFGITELPLGELLARLEMTYCGTIGVEMMHISDPARRTWLAERMESTFNRPSLDRATRLRILERLTAAEVFERFVHTKYLGTKRFSLEGGDSLIPLLDLVLEQAGGFAIEEVVIGMAHRGRLNVLANLLGKSAGDIFAEFEDVDPEAVLGGGDVKYHLGFSTDYTTRAGRTMHLSLAFNPSHLEAVDPIVAGRVRAKQQRRHDREHTRVFGLLIHGDAAFAGQGFVPETLNLSQLQGFRTGGMVHVIINNQIGFTTVPAASRSTPYPTDVAKLLEVPIFHVNGDDPEAVAQVVTLAMTYRQQYRCDVVIDLFCFRRYGHNESDEPSFTQPLLYQQIDHHPSVRSIYANQLVSTGVVDLREVEALLETRQRRLDEELQRARAEGTRPEISSGGGVWQRYHGGREQDAEEVDTTVSRARLAEISEGVTRLPAGFSPHPKIARLLTTRGEMGRGRMPLNWGMAETLAYGSLAWDGILVRLSGQDTRRGTFSHRHAVVVNIETGEEYVPLAHLHPNQGTFQVFDTSLSEAGVLGFEFGFSLDYPDALVIWEAQFGDFSNGAQVIIDQFISSAEDKWKRLSGLVLLLPHGFEGQGPEHSSARMERFLQLAAEDNLQVCYPTTPAQLFHLLRRQVLRRWRKPLVVLTPKSLLRLPAAHSLLDDLTTGRFARIFDDPAPPAEVERLLLCSGKIYYELLVDRQRRRAAVAILRVEQLYPWAEEELAEVLARYPTAREIVWVQEEPTNMGALQFLWPRLEKLAGKRALRAVARPESASPATGSSAAHRIEQLRLMEQAFSAIPEKT